MSAQLNLTEVLARLGAEYGPAPPPFPTDPFELVLWENVAYLSDDDARRAAFERLREVVGTRPEQIVRASKDDLVSVTSHGILAADFADKLRSAAEIALDEFDGDLHEVVARPVAAAKRALRRFPGIGEPGAEKILLYCRAHPFLAVESNGLRVLVRLGLCPQGKSYSTTYAAARGLGRTQIGQDFDALLAARYYLRRHGRELCRNKSPSCGQCGERHECPASSA